MRFAANAKSWNRAVAATRLQPESAKPGKPRQAHNTVTARERRPRLRSGRNSSDTRHRHSRLGTSAKARLDGYAETAYMPIRLIPAAYRRLCDVKVEEGGNRSAHAGDVSARRNRLNGGDQGRHYRP